MIDGVLSSNGSTYVEPYVVGGKIVSYDFMYDPYSDDRNKMNEYVRDQLIKAKQEGLVTIKPTPEGTMIVKYTRKCMYDNLWNDTIIRYARGHSFDADLVTLICNPFPKTFNPGEPRGFCFPNGTLVNWAKKYNGYMLSATNYQGQLYVSTTGTTTSNFAIMGRQWLLSLENEEYFQLVMDNPGETFIFEVCDPSDPHIVPEKPGLFLLGRRENCYHEMAFNRHHSNKPKNISELLQEVQYVDHEGFMCWRAEKCTKLKSPYYQVLKRIARSNSQQKMELMAGRSVKDFKSNAVFGNPLAYAGLNFKELSGMGEQERLARLRNYFLPMLEQARINQERGLEE